MDVIHSLYIWYRMGNRISNININTMKQKWFTETRHVDIETGEALSKSRVERERWIKVGSDRTVQDCGAYLLKINTNHYEKNRQTRLFE